MIIQGNATVPLEFVFPRLYFRKCVSNEILYILPEGEERTVPGVLLPDVDGGGGPLGGVEGHPRTGPWRDRRRQESTLFTSYYLIKM